MPFPLLPVLRCATCPLARDLFMVDKDEYNERNERLMGEDHCRRKLLS